MSGSCSAHAVAADGGVTIDASTPSRPRLPASIKARLGVFPGGSGGHGVVCKEIDEGVPVVPIVEEELSSQLQAVEPSLSLPLAMLRHAYGHVVLRLHGAHHTHLDTPYPAESHDDYTTVWDGTVTLARAFTCRPHGCDTNVFVHEG